MASESVGEAPREPRTLHMGEPQVLTETADDRLASIVIPVKDAGPGLRDLLLAILTQRWHGSVEVIALDSASRDDSVEILIASGATVLAVEPGTFDHGLTRNLGARRARGQTLVFVTQSMRPAHDRWLTNLVAPLARNGSLAGASSRILPHADADPLTRRDGLRDPSSSSDRDLRTIDDWERYRALDPEQLRRFVRFHTGSCAIRPEVLRQVPFRAMTTIGEDMLWAKEALEAGFSVLHEPSSVAFHSHDYGFTELLARNFDDGVAMREIVGRGYRDETILGHIEAQVAGDLRFLQDECAYTGVELERWHRTATVRRTAQLVGQWLGTEHGRLPSNAVSSLSLARQAEGSIVEPSGSSDGG